MWIEIRLMSKDGTGNATRRYQHITSVPRKGDWISAFTPLRKLVVTRVEWIFGATELLGAYIFVTEAD